MSLKVIWNKPYEKRKYHKGQQGMRPYERQNSTKGNKVGTHKRENVIKSNKVGPYERENATKGNKVGPCERDNVTKSNKKVNLMKQIMSARIIG